MKALRDVLIDQWVMEMQKDQSLVAIDCDMGPHTRVSKCFQMFPDRAFQAGICEQNAIGMAGGMARCRRFPLVSSFAAFIVGRCWEQIRHSVLYNEAPVLILGTHAGFAAAEDGGSHQCFEDIGLMLTLPVIQVFAPAFPSEARKIMMELACKKEAAYIRVGRDLLPYDISPDEIPPIGEPIVLHRSTSPVAVVSTGEITQVVLLASRKFPAEQRPTIVHLGCLRPFNRFAISRILENAKVIVCVEENISSSNLFPIISGIVHQSGFKAVRIINACRDGAFGESGDIKQLRQTYGIDADGIYQTIRSATGLQEADS